MSPRQIERSLWAVFGLGMAIGATLTTIATRIVMLLEPLFRAA